MITPAICTKKESLFFRYPFLSQDSMRGAKIAENKFQVHISPKRDHPPYFPFTLQTSKVNLMREAVNSF